MNRLSVSGEGLKIAHSKMDQRRDSRQYSRNHCLLDFDEMCYIRFNFVEETLSDNLVTRGLK